jgi:hypothetical protein
VMSGRKHDEPPGKCSKDDFVGNLNVPLLPTLDASPDVLAPLMDGKTAQLLAVFYEAVDGKVYWP